MKSMLFVAVVFVVFNSIQFGECTEGGLRRCRQNEEYVHCVKRCNTCVYQEDCWEDGRCIGGCDCKHGYFKNRRGKCVLERDCGCKCKKDEQYYRNMPDCKNTCENYDNPGVRCKPGKSGCFCREGLVKRKDGKCVRPEECFTEKCGPNEIYSKCVNPCNNCELRGNCQFLVCNKGCDCKPGFRRDEYERCIPESQCPPGKCTKKGEVYKSCGSPCEATCSTIHQRTLMRCPTVCKAGCFCRDGLVRDSNRNCVKPCECEKHPECGKHEQYYECIPSCKGYCETYNKNIACKMPCKPGCFCKKGFVKRKDGKCVRPKDCFRSGHSHDWKREKGSYEERSFDDDEDNDEGGHEGYSDEKEYEETSGHEDREERAFDENDEEVENGNESDGNEDFKKEKCRADEVYQKCGSLCPDTCENYGKPHACAPICIPGCFCKKGLVRSKDGRCIIPEKCGKEKCNDDEEYQTCGSSCPDTCDNYGKPRTCTAECVYGCFCKRGLVRNNQFNCVIPERCRKTKKQCNKDEIYIQCGTACPETCDNYGQPRPCPKICVPGCFCRKGLIRNVDTKKCVRPWNCWKPHLRQDSKETGVEHYRDDGEGSDHEESDEGEEGTSENDDFEHESETGHDSGEQRYLIDDDKGSGDDKSPKSHGGKPGPGPVCFIPKCDVGCTIDHSTKPCPTCRCHDKHKCKRHEQYYDCIPSCRGTCETYNKPILCSQICVPGCYCKKGRVKRKDGKCVKPKDCPKEPTPCGKDEIYVECVPCGNTCETYPQRKYCKPICKPGCTCKDGLVKRKDGKCVPPRECKEISDCGKNEEIVDCVKPKWCNTCEIKGNCKLSHCTRGCDCKRGFYRNARGICIPEYQCHKCKRDEEYYRCTPDCYNRCVPKKACPKICRPGCFCRKGLVLREDGKCVKRKHCNVHVRCKKDEQYYECTPSCKNTCRNYNNPAVRCGCGPPGCFCREGLVQTDDGRCVKPEDCPGKDPHCGPDEEYYKCKPFCTNKCNPTKVCPTICISGCFCRKGLVLREDGKCVRRNQCSQKPPDDKKCKKDEQYYECMPDCRNTCEACGRNDVICPAICKAGCFCKEGLVKRKDGKCVKPEQCKLQVIVFNAPSFQRRISDVPYQTNMNHGYLIRPIRSFLPRFKACNTPVVDSHICDAQLAHGPLHSSLSGFCFTNLNFDSVPSF